MKYIYMLKAGENNYKVGVAKDVNKRVASIQTSNPHEIEVVTAKLVNDATAAEKAVHIRLADFRSGGGTEWFTLTPEQALEVCIVINRYPDAVTQHDISVHEAIEESRAAYMEILSKLNLIARAAQLHKDSEFEFDMPTAAKLAKQTIDDKMVDNVLKVFKERGRVSVSLIQVTQRVGYGRAARLMDLLEHSGLVTEPDDKGVRHLVA